MRPEISDKTVKCLDMAVKREVSNSALVKQLDTDTKIQILLESWADAHQDRAAAESEFGTATWQAPWNGKNSLSPPWR